MRRRKEQAMKLRVKILQDRKDGLTYEEIQRSRGASSRTIANLVKGKDPKRFCEQCGETDPEKLEQHHPDKVNRPNDTRTLCASCHSKVTREQQRKMNKDAKKEIVIPKIIPPLNISAQRRMPNPPHMTYSQPRPLTPQEKRWLGRGAVFSGGGIALGEGVFDKRLPGWLRLLLGMGGVALLYTGSRIK